MDPKEFRNQLLTMSLLAVLPRVARAGDALDTLEVQKIVEAIASMRFDWKQQTYEIGASAGIAAITSASPRAALLMAEADFACYAAKSAGRNRVSISDRLSVLARSA